MVGSDVAVGSVWVIKGVVVVGDGVGSGPLQVEKRIELMARKTIKSSEVLRIIRSPLLAIPTQ